MTNHSTALVQKLCNYPDFVGAGCHILRDDGLSYGDCVEQEQIVAEVERRLSVVELRGRHARLRELSVLVN